MKRSGKAQPSATPAGAPPAQGMPADPAGSAGGARPPSGPDKVGRRANRPDAAESVAGEEDPGSALEQFSDLMQGPSEQGGPAAKAAARQPRPASARRGTSDSDAEPDAAPVTRPGRRD